MPLNVEIKARCARPEPIREVLRAAQADFRGRDHQIDTYFVVPHGRLKLREGNIENHLIYYQRADEAGPKRSEVYLYEPGNSAALHALLREALGVRVVVDKWREIWFVGNVKFHIDEVAALGSFVEIEAIDRDGSIGEDRLRQQCTEWMARLGIRDEDLIDRSYSDMLLERNA
ncbi:MAG: CYTH domain-containing protein [Bacteroidetes bacterium]|nr:MAG: CYTH domain-containing protein [Bacteroidota bacterium]